MDIPARFADVFGRMREVREQGNEWVCLCPAHQDKTPSLTVSLSDDGNRLLLWCRRNCGIDEICDGLGIKKTDLFAGGERKQVKARTVATYPYLDEKGNELFQVVRQEWDNESGRHKTFKQRHRVSGEWVWNITGVKRVIYRLPELLANPKQPVCVVEGEKDVERLLGIKLVATCNPGGAGKWLLEYGRWLSGRRVAVIADNDEPGREHAATVAGSAVHHGAASVRIVTLPVQVKGDVSDYLNAGGTKESLLKIIRATPEYKR